MAIVKGIITKDIKIENSKNEKNQEEVYMLNLRKKLNEMDLKFQELKSAIHRTRNRIQEKRI